MSQLPLYVVHGDGRVQLNGCFPMPRRRYVVSDRATSEGLEWRVLDGARVMAVASTLADAQVIAKALNG